MIGAMRARAHDPNVPRCLRRASVARATSVFLLLALSGCGAVVSNPTPAPTTLAPPGGAVAEYRIHVGDELDIKFNHPAGLGYRIRRGDQLDVKFLYNPELNEHALVRPDGQISLQFVNDVPAAGLTPSELTADLKKRYASELNRPELSVLISSIQTHQDLNDRVVVRPDGRVALQLLGDVPVADRTPGDVTALLKERYGAVLGPVDVAVILRSFAAQKVYVGGEVGQPGVVDSVAPLTVLQAISRTGGMKETARVDEIVIIRRQADGRGLAIPVNLSKAIDGSDIGQDIALMPFDIVYVPKSGVSNVNQWVDQYIRRNIPIPLNFGFIP